jgi:hypothetical protein
MTLLEGEDARPEEASDVGPAGRDEPPRRGEADSYVCIPDRAREPTLGYLELQHRDRASRSDDARELDEHGGRVVHVAEEIGERKRVKRAVLVRKLLGSALFELDPVLEDCGLDATLSGGEHLAALVDSDDVAAVSSRQLDGDRGGPAGHIEDGVARACAHARDEEGAPARILAEGEDRRIAVVRRTERCEKLFRAPRALSDAFDHAAIVAAMTLEDEIGAARTAADAFAGDGEEIVGVVPSEPRAGRRVYICAFRAGEEERWLALDAHGAPVEDRTLVRDAVSIAALCELAEDGAGGGDLPQLRARLGEIRDADHPEGIEEAEQAAAALAETLREPPRIATPDYLDEIGAAADRLEKALGDPGASPFAVAMQAGVGAAEELAERVERSYKSALA